MDGLNYTDAQIHDWLQGKSPDQIAAEAAKLGLNQSQIQQALQIGGINASADDITSNAAKYGYNFNGANGGLQADARVNGQNGMYDPQGNWLSKGQIQDFYARGGDDSQYYQQHGGTDLGAQHDALINARQLGANGAMTGDKALQHYFQQYKLYNPNGQWANDYQGWANDFMSDPARAGAVQSGTYTGTANAPADSDFGGIYGPGTGHDITNWRRSGFGARGMDDGWNAGVLPGNGTVKTGRPYSVYNTSGMGLHGNSDGTVTSYDPNNHTVYDTKPTGGVDTWGNGTPTTPGGTTGTTPGGSGHTPGSSLVTTPGNYLGALGSAFTLGVTNPYQHIYRTDQMGPWMNYHADGLPSSAPITFHPQPESSFYSALQTPTRQTSPGGQVIQYAPGALTRSGV